jgi:hypothetical protein
VVCPMWELRCEMACSEWRNLDLVSVELSGLYLNRVSIQRKVVETRVSWKIGSGKYSVVAAKLGMRMRESMVSN